MTKFTVTAEEKGTRLDKFLTPKLAPLSRSQIQKLIKNGHVNLNDKPTDVHHFLKENDLVSVNIPTEPKKPTKIKLPKIKILHEDSDLLVISKPAGISVHPAQGITEVTIVDWLLANYPETATVGDEPAVRPGIVHRLDKDVSGCLLMAKNQKGFEVLKNQFQEHTIKKEYTALVYGKVSKDTDEINFPISRGATGKMVARAEGEDGREAVTLFDVVERYPQYTLLLVKTLTGRTHQIRTHLKAYGHSIVGDNLYANKNQIIKEKLSQIFLHAGKLGFTDISGNWQETKTPLPKELNDFLKTLNKIRPTLIC